LEFQTAIPKISPQNTTKPILEEKVYPTYTYNSDFNSYYDITLFWKVIKYKEKKGISRLFDKVLGL
jgi:hypothetical protein